MSQKVNKLTFHYQWEALSDGLDRLVKAYQFLLTKDQEDKAWPGFTNRDKQRGNCCEEEKLKGKKDMHGKK